MLKKELVVILLRIFKVLKVSKVFKSLSIPFVASHYQVSWQPSPHWGKPRQRPTSQLLHSKTLSVKLQGHKDCIALPLPEILQESTPSWY